MHSPYFWIMKGAYIRFLVVLAIVTLIGIITTQIYWLNRAIAQQDQVFNHNVHLALQNVVESLCEASGKDFPATNPIEQVASNYYIVRANDQIDLANLEYLISSEISKRAITEDFDYGVYDCESDEMVFAESVNLLQDHGKSVLPRLKDQEYYFGVYFPEKSRSVIARLDLWKFTTGLTLIVIVFFGYALFVILKQKRWSDIQKDFINNVSHELKTPLATLNLASHALSQKATTEANKKYAGIIQSEVSRLMSSVERILIASVSESKTKITRSEVDLKALVGAIVGEFKRHHASEGFLWTVSLDGVRPIVSNPALIESCLINLLENAVKYGGKNIQVAVEQTHAYTTLIIADDGVGIPSKHQKYIFEKFYRVPENQSQHNTKGFGLGLQIVKNSVKKLRGTLSLHSEEGQGTTFKIQLPNG